MPELQTHTPPPSPDAYSAVTLVYSSDGPDSWSVLTVNQGGLEFVAITRRPPAGLARDPSYQPGDYFFLPPELATPVLSAARQLEAQRQSAILKGYEEMAADEEAEREAFEWIESHVGECL